MWNWLKRKSARQDDQLRELFEKLLGPAALVTALAESVGDYFSQVQAGKASYPAHRRKDISVAQLWTDLRLEALHMLFGFGKADAFRLAVPRHQSELLDCFLDEKPHLEMPQPRGEVNADTIQAMFQVYRYLSEVGSEVADRETWYDELKRKGMSILDQIESDCARARSQLRAFLAREEGSSAPPMMIEMMYADVTAKAKSISFTTVFGPKYESGIKFAESLVEKQGGDVAPFRASVECVLAATDPDHLRK